MSNTYSKQLIDHFTNRLSAAFSDYCQRHQITAAPNDFITFLIDQKIVGVTAIRRFTILKEFEELYPKNQYHKTKTVRKLAGKFHLSERAIWSIIKYNPKK